MPERCCTSEPCTLGCVTATYYNSILDLGSVAWECVFGPDSGDPFPAMLRKQQGCDNIPLKSDICSGDVNVVRNAIATMQAECASKDPNCSWAEIAADYSPKGDCTKSANVSTGNMICRCDFECLEAAMNCIIDRCCSADCCDLDMCSGGPWGGDADCCVGRSNRCVNDPYIWCQPLVHSGPCATVTFFVTLQNGVTLSASVLVNGGVMSYTYGEITLVAGTGNSLTVGGSDSQIYCVSFNAINAYGANCNSDVDPCEPGTEPGNCKGWCEALLCKLHMELIIKGPKTSGGACDCVSDGEETNCVVFFGPENGPETSYLSCAVSGTMVNSTGTNPATSATMSVAWTGCECGPCEGETCDDIPGRCAPGGGTGTGTLSGFSGFPMNCLNGDVGTVTLSGNCTWNSTGAFSVAAGCIHPGNGNPPGAGSSYKNCDGLCYNNYLNPGDPNNGKIYALAFTPNQQFGNVTCPDFEGWPVWVPGEAKAGLMAGPGETVKSAGDIGQLSIHASSFSCVNNPSMGDYSACGAGTRIDWTGPYSGVEYTTCAMSGGYPTTGFVCQNPQNVGSFVAS